MVPFAPFPRAPVVAVALSGGADSLALLLLLRDWTGRRGGRALALIVDHGLRPESAEEARAVARQARTLGVESQVLTWTAEPPASGLQAKAREARYRLLEAACRARGLLYLASGHHREDQAETFLLRLESGSGVAGLAGMTALRVLDDLVLLRPLLQVPKARLEALLRARSLRWVDDPSNRDTRQRRAALRRLGPQLAEQGLQTAEIAGTVALFCRLRRSLELAGLRWLGANCDWRPEGYAILDRSALGDPPHPSVVQAVALVLRTIGGSVYGPAPQRMASLLASLRAGEGSTTLGGCRLIAAGERLLVVRESRAARPVSLEPGRQTWDRRFRLHCGLQLPAGLCLASLTEAGWARLEPRPARLGLPPAVLWSLPSVWDRNGPLAVPHLGWRRRGLDALDLSLKFHPRSLPGSAVFSVA